MSRIISSTEQPFDVLAVLSAIIAGTAEAITEKRRKAFRLSRIDSGEGRTLRPGRDTPLWNALVEEVRPLLKKRGTQAQLARLLGLERQAVNAYFTGRTRMPDAERTLQLIAWLVAVKQGLPPS